MRIPLPVDPYYKTMSEVATVDWIRCTTSLPVPSIVNYQPSRDNLIGFEWILMTKMPGKPLGEIWSSLPFSAKSSLVRKFAAYSACLFRNQIRGIGIIYGEPCLAEYSLTEENPPNRDRQILRSHFEHKHLYRTREQMLPIPDVHQNQCLKWAELYPTRFSGGLTYTRPSTEARFVQARTGSELALCSTKMTAIQFLLNVQLELILMVMMKMELMMQQGHYTSLTS